MFDNLEFSGELDTELGIELYEMLRKGLGRPEYQPEALSLSERIFFRTLRIVVVTFVISLVSFAFKSFSGPGCFSSGCTIKCKEVLQLNRTLCI
jgi:hypothetical protein